jgi:hypothetical protein
VQLREIAVVDAKDGLETRSRTGLALALLALAALVLQLAILVDVALGQGRTVLHAIGQFIAYFTVLTNLFVMLVAFAPWNARRGPVLGFFARSSVLGAATSAIVLVGIVYHLLLRETWDPQGWQRVADVGLHYVVPTLALVHWIATRRGRRIPIRHIVLWCAWPATYLGYALLRGAATGFYPYPFLDVPAVGWHAIGLNALALLAAFLALSAGVRWLGSGTRG